MTSQIGEYEGGSLTTLQKASFLLLLTIFAHTPIISKAATLQQDVDALNNLHKAWLGNPVSWDFSTDPCEGQWLGIRCDSSQTRVTQLLLINQGLAGTLSILIGNLTSLTDLDISSNPNLGGPLPAEIRSLVNMERFFAQFCNFSGPIPSEIGNMIRLKIFGLSQNSFTGALPATVGLLTNLTWFDVSSNNLSGSLPVSSSSGTGSGLDNLTKAQHIHLQNNIFSETIPPSLFVEGMQLQHLSLDSANLTGNIPAEIFGFNSYLSNVSLGSNQLNGTLNLTEASLSPLLIVNLTDNDITNLEKGDYNQELLMDGNPYCNSNPTECTPTEVGTPGAPLIPAECTNACASDYAINRKNSSSCQCAYPVVSTCTFDATKFPSLTDLVSEIERIFAVGLSGSQYLEGYSFQDTQVVVDVLSTYDIKVSVFPPSNMTIWSSRNATLISYVMHNQDIDFVPIGAVLCKFTGNSYAPVLKVVTRLSTGAIVGIAIGAGVFTIVIIVLMLYAMKLKQRALRAEKLNKPFAAWIVAGQENSTHMPQLKGARWFSLSEVRNCTNNFSQRNEIGEGGYGKVYKGFLSLGDQVAIKRASANSLQGVAEFRNEIEHLSRVHHRNLVGLIGFCFEEGEQMLVYEYMPNGTLRDCLSGRTGLRMDWMRRIDLVLGSARGIAYLHTEANPSIIHRDIKSSNILLNDKLEAKVADFGLSKLALDGGAGIAVETTQVKGTFGYLDPDYFMTSQLTSKSDVYSFGVVLLEVITGRLPIQGGKCLAHEVTKRQVEGGIDLILQEWVDPSLGEYPRKALERLLEVALTCVKNVPHERPSMAEIVKELEALSSPAQVIDTINVNEEQFRIDEQGLLPYTQGSFAFSSFEYSGSYRGISTFLQPK